VRVDSLEGFKILGGQLSLIGVEHESSLAACCDDEREQGEALPRERGIEQIFN
jgi:hypothetical protein